jgi:signal transduction histidine kinase
MGEPDGGAIWRIATFALAVLNDAMFRLALPIAADSQMPDSGIGTEEDFAATHPLRPLVLAGAMTLIAYSGGVVAVSFIAQGFVPAAVWRSWLVAECLFLAAWLTIIVTVWLRKPSARETVIVWGHASRFIAFTSQILLPWLIWGFFPYLPQTEQMILAGMLLTCSPAQLIAAPENVWTNRFGILASSGSLALWFVLNASGAGSVNDYAMGGFALAIGIMLIVLSDYLPGTVSEAAQARVAAEQAKVELERALEAVAEERDAKTRFIAAASHDLGQPLQAASLFFDQTLRAPDPTQRDRAVDGVRKAFASADQLISHMLNHLRLEADAVDPHMARVGLGPIMARIATQFGPAASAAGIAIRAMPARARISLDRVLLERALGNLVGNAIAHSGATRILIGARKHGGYIRIWVIDNGCGIARVDAERVFDDYYRGSDSQAVVKSGFGLGLSSVRRIATLMNGTAGLDQNWLGGAAFFLEFPLQIRGKEAPI